MTPQSKQLKKRAKILGTKYGFNLDIINSETDENLSAGFMSDNMRVIIKALRGYLAELEMMYPNG